MPLLLKALPVTATAIVVLGDSLVHVFVEALATLELKEKPGDDTLHETSLLSPNSQKSMDTWCLHKNREYVIEPAIKAVFAIVKLKMPKPETGLRKIEFSAIRINDPRSTIDMISRSYQSIVIFLGIPHQIFSYRIYYFSTAISYKTWLQKRIYLFLKILLA